MNDYTQLPQRQKMFTMAATLLGMLLAALDQTIVSTAGPAIQRDLHIEASLYTWLTTSYLVASAVMTPVWGKLSDLFGRRRILVIGILIFLGGSLLCGVSQTTWQLIAARIIQGFGSASLFTTAFAVIADIFTPRERGRYAGVFGAVFGLSSVVGPLVGGFITDTLSWHWCFLINLPVGAVALAVIGLKMPSLKRQEEGGSKKIDVVGAVIFAGAVVPALVAASLAKVELRAGDVGYLWSSPIIIGLVIMAVVFGVLFVVVERKVSEPLIDMKLFGNRAFSLGVSASFIVGMAFLGAIVFLPLFMVNVVGASATGAGLTTVPLTFGIVFGNIFSGQVSSRLGRYKFLMLGSLGILVVAFAVMSFTLSPDVTQAGMAARMILIGLGLGPSIPMFNLHIQTSVEPRQIGAATSVATLSRSLGSTLGVAIFGNIFGLVLVNGIETRIADATAHLPPAAVAQLKSQMASAAPAAAAGEEGAPTTGTFDVAAAKARIAEGFAARRQVLSGAGPEAAGQLAGLQAAEAEALKTVDAVSRAFKQAFTDATARVYFVGIFFALLGLVVTLVLPELPLRGGMPTPPPVE